MKLALRLAAKGRGGTSPNPMVGSVIVKNGQIVGKGYHRRAGTPHAEILALHEAGPQARGGTLYVSLEPCSHIHKRTPPCVPAIVRSALRRVVVAMADPNPKVNGEGIRQLLGAGLTVDVGCGEEAARRLNEAYIHWIQTRRPFVILKAAITLDGKIATATGESRWITGAQARRHVHRLRSEVDAVMVGIGTILTDDPQLSAREPFKESRSRNFPQPVRVVLDSRLRIPPSAQVLKWTAEQPTIIATTHQAPSIQIQAIREQGAIVLVVPQKQGVVSLRACLAQLGKMGLNSVLLEGGSELNAKAVQCGLVNRVMLYVASCLLGGQNAKGVLGSLSPNSLTGATSLYNLAWRKLGEDVLITGDISTPH